MPTLKAKQYKQGFEAARFMQSIYLEKLDGKVKITEMVERLASLDRENHSKVVFEDTHLGWREAA